MGGRKLRFHHRKQHRKQSLVVSLPVSSTPSLESLYSCLVAETLPELWTVVSKHPLVIVKLRVHQTSTVPRVDVVITLAVNDSLNWTLSAVNISLNPALNSSLKNIASTIFAVSDILDLVKVLDSLKFCVGNPDAKFLEWFKHRSTTLHGLSGCQSSFLDAVSIPTTLRHNKCLVLLPTEAGQRCSACVTYRVSLTVQSSRFQRVADECSPSAHTNFRFQPVQTLVDRLHRLRQQCKTLNKKLQRMKVKITESVESCGVVLDDEVQDDFIKVLESPECTSVFEKLPKDSFQSIFWQQQMESLDKNPKSMRWHPLMIRWCLYLRHRSSGAYELLRSSGCLKLPSQRTLRDYTHYVQAGNGFSGEVDQMLVDAAKITSCPKREKCVILLLDEMHIRQDLVFDKHTGAMIGFCSLGDTNDHLLKFEQSLSISDPPSPKLAKTMMVFMVRGVFNKLQFPYAQFPCADLSGDLLYEPFWEAVGRLEACGFKVLGATLDGNSVNRRLVKLHEPSSDVAYKVKNPFTNEDRFFYFFSDVPHLMKTTRNNWVSTARNLHNNGQRISWGHLRKLYEQDTAPGVGVRMLPKLKYEHICLTSFSKMRVDLAAQVLSESVSKMLKLTGGPEVAETAKFVEFMDKFFDALNVSNYANGIQRRKKFQLPYTTAKDERIEWLEGTFLPYLYEWEAWAECIPDLTKTERNNLLLSAETRLGLKMTCKSFIELVRYVFTLEDVTSFLSQRLCQDPLENFFGCQRQRGGVHDNPNAQEFAKNTQALRVVNSFCKGPPRGNCRGGTSEQNKENYEPLPKRKRTDKYT